MYDLQNKYLDEYDSRSEILAATSFTVILTYHTTVQATQGQLVLESDIILNTPLMTYLGAIKLCKQKIIDNNN